jgi:hypothetical protein
MFSLPLHSAEESDDPPGVTLQDSTLHLEYLLLLTAYLLTPWSKVLLDKLTGL